LRIIVRMLRNSRALDALISRTKQQILAATLLQPSRSWYLLELARHLGVRPSSLQRELKKLAQTGVLQKRTNGNRVYFQADPAFPIRPELASILAKTVGVIDVLREDLFPLKDRITVAFVYGSMATSTERSDSDIDLMVVGSSALSEIAKLLTECRWQCRLCSCPPDRLSPFTERTSVRNALTPQFRAVSPAPRCLRFPQA
jgi:DNA-binding transcriptional ArsR family regulator